MSKAQFVLLLLTPEILLTAFVAISTAILSYTKGPPSCVCPRVTISLDSAIAQGLCRCSYDIHSDLSKWWQLQSATIFTVLHSIPFLITISILITLIMAILFILLKGKTVIFNKFPKSNVTSFIPWMGTLFCISLFEIFTFSGSTMRTLLLLSLAYPVLFLFWLQLFKHKTVLFEYLKIPRQRNILIFATIGIYVLFYIFITYIPVTICYGAGEAGSIGTHYCSLKEFFSPGHIVMFDS
ncbi:MAG TPA: hypothetical protein VEW42_01945 [Candidatus Eisenbacteria bacterium]|nr:hypothetical protein [Candidatus Eisenbacteria bacterium]